MKHDTKEPGLDARLAVGYPQGGLVLGLAELVANAGRGLSKGGYHLLHGGYKLGESAILIGKGGIIVGTAKIGTKIKAHTELNKRVNAEIDTVDSTRLEKIKEEIYAEYAIKEKNAYANGKAILLESGEVLKEAGRDAFYTLAYPIAGVSRGISKMAVNTIVGSGLNFYHALHGGYKLGENFFSPSPESEIEPVKMDDKKKTTEPEVTDEDVARFRSLVEKIREHNKLRKSAYEKEA